MNKIERPKMDEIKEEIRIFGRPSADNSKKMVAYIDQLENINGELVDALKGCVKRAIESNIEFILEKMVLDAYRTEIEVIEKATGQTWQEIKEERG